MTQAVWDDRLAAAFAPYHAGGSVYCQKRKAKKKKKKETCTVDGNTTFVFSKGKKPKLTEIRLPLAD